MMILKMTLTDKTKNNQKLVMAQLKTELKVVMMKKTWTMASVPKTTLWGSLTETTIHIL